MRSDENLKKRRYEIVAKILSETTNFTRVDDLCLLAGMTKLEFSQSISKARLELAKEGTIIVNKHGDGYKVGNIDEFVIEMDKACKRALSQAMGMGKLIYELKKSGAISVDNNIPDHIVKDNIKNIMVIFDRPQYEDFESYEEFKDEIDQHFETSRIHSERLKRIPDEIVSD